MDDSLDLLSRMQHGDRDALERLLQRHLAGLRGFVRLRGGELLRSKETSIDLVQSVCREVLEHMDRFQFPSEAGFRHWLFTTALRKIRDRYDYYLARKRNPAMEADVPSDASHGHLLEGYGSFCTPSREVEAREEVERIELAFEKLPEHYREVILLAGIVGLSRAEIGERIGRSETNVRALLARARARLSEILARQ